MPYCATCGSWGPTGTECHGEPRSVAEAWQEFEITVRDDDEEPSRPVHFVGVHLASQRYDGRRWSGKEVFVTRKGKLLIYFRSETSYLTRDLTEEELDRNLQGELLYEVRQALGWVTVEELDV
jgi:hypothetical protein